VRSDTHHIALNAQSIGDEAKTMERQVQRMTESVHIQEDANRKEGKL
jgi:hypothetical protein